MPAKKTVSKTKTGKKSNHAKPAAKKKRARAPIIENPSPPANKENFDILDTSGTTFWQATTVIFALLFLLSIFTQGFTFQDNTTESASSTQSSTIDVKSSGSEANSATEKLAENAVKLDFYVMSQCPYGTQVEDAIKPVLDKLGNTIDFNLNFIASDNGDGTFKSLHGQPEVEGNIVQLCAAKYNPDIYMEMILCQNKDEGAIPGNWEKCAQDNNLDVSNIMKCFEGEEGKELLRTSIKASEKVNAQGSPTIYLNDKPYQGGRGENDFFRAVCNAFEGTKPAACSDIPEPKKVNGIVITDERCGKKCDTTQLVAQLESLFPGLDTKTLDYSEKEAKDLLSELDLQYLPVVLFDETVKEAEGFTNIERYLIKTGEYLKLQIGASFDPTAEICDNDIDDNDDGKIDCEDSDCEQSMLCREEKNNHLQVFVMSDCPYGRMAIEALKGVVDNFGDKVDYEVHYIAQESGDGFSSLHGQYEVDENIVQLCVKEKSPQQWLDYLYCRSIKGVNGIDWKGCAEETEVNIDAVETCSTTDVGKDLLREDIKIAKSLNIGSSPTWMSNNKYTFSGIDSETVKTNICKYNEGLEGCDTTLSSDTGGVPPGSC